MPVNFLNLSQLNLGFFLCEGRGCMRVGGTVWNTLKGGGKEKKGGKTKILKRRKAGSRGRGLKRGGGGGRTSLQTMKDKPQNGWTCMSQSVIKISLKKDYHYLYSAMGISGSIQQCRCKYHLCRIYEDKKIAVVRFSMPVVFIFTTNIIVNYFWKID